MTDEKRAKIREVRELIKKAEDKLTRLCEGVERWRMSIPADIENDPDIVFANALHRADEALALLDAEDKPSVPKESGKEEPR